MQKQARQLYNRRFTDSFTCQTSLGENCWSIEDRAGHQPPSSVAKASSKSPRWLGEDRPEERTRRPGVHKKRADGSLGGGTAKGLKSAIEGRIRARANAHRLFAETRWNGAELSNIVTQELAPYSEKAEKGVRIDGPQVLLEPNAAQAIAVTLHELATNADE